MKRFNFALSVTAVDAVAAGHAVSEFVAGWRNEDFNPTPGDKGEFRANNDSLVQYEITSEATSLADPNL